MIQVNKLHKYFNKGKSNEIHVINDTCLEFGNTGLVCILGESGSGKTTLLNTLGGLDVFHNGSINFDGTNVAKHSIKEMERIRNSKFGYIFQEKYLLQDYTVAYNIRLALNMYDLSDEEKEARIDYVLKSVDMLKYKKRLVSQLSGGQQQRIAIARALVKSPDVIFADEPTGSLDEASTMRIMSIIKKISRECLVILVTHEKRIAEFFADRIIRIKDGRVIYDALWEDQKTYQYSDDTNLYLKEFDKESYHNNEIKINVFGNGRKHQLVLNLVYLNDKYYVQTPDEEKVVFLTSNNETQMVDDYKPTLDMEQVEEFDYSLERLEASKRSKFSYKDIYQLAKVNVKMLGKRQIFMIASFIIASVLLVIALVDYMTAAAVDKKSIITRDSNYISVEAKRNSSAEDNEYINSYNLIYNKFISDRIAPDIYLDLKTRLSFTDDSFEQITNLQYIMSDFSYVTLEHFKADDLVYGRMPKSRDEVIIDKWLLDVFYKSDSILKTLLPDPQDFLGLELKSTNASLTIVGICDMDEPTIFIDKYKGLSLAYPSNNVASLEQLQAAYPGQYDNITLGKDEVLVSESYNKVREGNGNKMPISGDMYQVVGTYPDDFGADYVIGKDTYYAVLSRSIFNDKKFVIYAEDKTPILNYFAQNLGGFDKTFVELKVSDTYHEQLATFKAERAVKMNARLIATLVIFGVSMFMLFFTMKSNAIKRVQEISVYRLMGISKRSIISSFILEIILMTNDTVLPVVLIFSSMIKFIASVPSFQLTIVYPWLAMIALLVFIYAVNIIVGILPVYGIVKLPPARIEEKA
ncbi:MAG TPA: ATP-binding cassette domain-containing protein [Mobilitalea sp.]|nr:ATP-binding cassette domain-containing protein [Mobilitalea sp.]